ncbi:thioesterase family protein [uncultured Bacteroides sp.]|jgi:fluoroacetyl-CoA thioesterase|uniref:thioesterase family protein n=1 Tax=Bacteroides ilei TaxID=1907658 RepID=UPI00280C1FFB|nr:thioesterase family protein [uncultured Bacteroides sp.]
MEKGLTYTSRTIVNKNNTALTLGSGDMEVLGTPAMLALMENAAMNSVCSHLPEGSTTVGSMIESTHIRPSAIGETITATATLEKIENRKLTFKVTAADSKGLIGEGTHIRYIVDRKRFLGKL